VSDRIKNISKIRIEGEKSHIDSIAQRLSDKAAAITKVYETRLDRAALSIKAASARILDSHLHKLSNIETSVRLLDPSNVLSRGYSITYHNGHALTNAKQLVAGDSITTRLFDGTIISAVTEIENADDAAG
jgi:exodeoxyribonuclease VII large subunit